MVPTTRPLFFRGLTNHSDKEGRQTEADSCGKHIAQTLSKVCWQQREASHGFPFSTTVGKMAPKLSPLPHGQGYNQSLSSAPTATHQKAWDVHRVTAMYYGLLETATDPSSWAWLLVAHSRKSGSYPPKLSLGHWMNGIHCEKMLNFYAHAPAHTRSHGTPIPILRHSRIHISGRSNLLVLNDTQRGKTDSTVHAWEYIVKVYNGICTNICAVRQ